MCGKNELYPWQGPIPIIKVQGNPFDMGYSYGRQCRNLVQMTAERWWTVFLALPRVGKKRLEREVEHYKEVIEREIGEEYLEEMRGLAEGSDLDFEEILLINCSWDLLLTLPTPEAHVSYMSACSSFAAWGKAVSEGNVICGHNDDGARYRDQFLVLLIAQPEKGNTFATPIVPGYLGYHSMVNDKGFVHLETALENGCPSKEFSYNLPMWILLRYLAQYSDGTKEATDKLLKFSPSTPLSFLFSDKNSEIQLIQATSKHNIAIEPVTNFTVLTNHALSENIKNYLLMREHPSSTDYRYQTIKKHIEDSKGAINLTGAKRIMGSHFDSSCGKINPGANTPCNHREYEGELAGTVRSIVVRISDNSVSGEVSLGNPCNGEWVGFEFNLDEGGDT